tara:strand:+ start:53 stop:175 length:123 start_codon:yes stop_codon:yes gene_type:complete
LVVAVEQDISHDPLVLKVVVHREYFHQELLLLVVAVVAVI